MAVRIPIITTFDKKGVNNALRSLDNVGAAAGKAAAVLATGAAVGIAASVNEFAKFEGALQKSLAIMGDVSETMRGEMSDAAREVAKTTTFSAEAAADSFFFLASAGLTAEQSVAALPQVAAFAQAGMFDMATATDLATDAQSALGLTSDDAAENLAGLTRITDVFVKANTLANTTVEQLASALTSKAGAALKTVGKDVEEGSAALAVFADQGIKGEKAGTLLTNTIFGLAERVKVVPEQFEELGISVVDSSGELRNFADISDDFTVAMEDMTTEQKLATLSNLGFTKQSREGLLALLGNGEALRGYEDALRSAGGTAQEVADKQLQTFNGQLALLGSAANDVALEIGSKMAPIIAELIPVIERLLPVIGDQLIAALEGIDFERLLTDISAFITFIANNIDKLDDLIVILATVAITLGTVTTAIRIATTAAAIFGVTLTTALLPIALIAAAIALVVAGLVAFTLASDDSRKSQSELSDEIVQTKDRIKEYRDAAAEAGRDDMFQRQIERLETKLRKLKIATGEVIEFTKASVVETDRMRFASQAFKDQMGLNQGPMKQTADDFNAIANAATNARLGVTDLTAAQEAQRIFNDLIARHMRDGIIPANDLYEQTLKKVTARMMFQTQAQVDYQEELRQLGHEMGLVVPGFEATSSAMDGLSGSTIQATDEFSELRSEINKATEAALQFAKATPGSPGPGGLFEVVLPDGSTALANLDGIQEGLRVAGSKPKQPAPSLKGIADDEQDFIKSAFPELFPEVALGLGGIVMKPTRALIGEAGPEAVIPLDQFNRSQNNNNTVNITVNTGVGSDPVATGRAVVDAIKRYESVNGKVFVTA